MAAPMERFSDTSSSDEDEETNAKLKEAVFGFGIATEVQTKTDFSQRNEKERIPSKRPDKEVLDADQFDNEYNTTPGFRKHVSKKLSQALDSVIDSSSQYFGKSGGDYTEETSGVRLFSSSKLALQMNSPAGESVKPVNKRRLPSSSDSSSEDERLAEASVSHDFVLQQSNLPYLANQKAADIVIKQVVPPDEAFKNNNQADSSKNDTKIKNKSDEKSDLKLDQVNSKDEMSDISVKKHKKKKKKKHKKGVD